MAEVTRRPQIQPEDKIAITKNGAAIKKVVITKSTAPTSLIKKSFAEIHDLTLPEERSIPSTNLGDYSYLFHGDQGIGKTTLASQFEDALHLMCEPGGASLSIRQTPILSWEHALGYVDLLEERGTDYCQTIVIENANILYNFCFNWKIKQLGMTDIKDKAFGSVYPIIEDEFRRLHFRIKHAGFGLVVVCHSDIKDKKEKIGGKWVTTGDYLKIELGAQGLRLYKAIIDVTGHYRKENVGGKKQRFLYLQDYDDVADTKQRIKGRFLSPSTGEKLERVSMGKTEEEAYENFEAAFNNTYVEEEGGPNIIARKAVV